MGFQYRFGTLSSWATTSVNGTTAYWARCRVLDASVITQDPVVSHMALMTNNSTTNADGFLEYYGNARPVKSLTWTCQNFARTGATGTPARDSFQPGNSGGVLVDMDVDRARLDNGQVDGVAHGFSLPTGIDTSEQLRLTVFYVPESGTGDIAVDLAHVFTKLGDTMGDIGGSVASEIPVSSGIITETMPNIAGKIGSIVFDIDLSAQCGCDGTHMWFNFIRRGTDAADTFGGFVIITSISVQYRIWTDGSYAYT